MIEKYIAELLETNNRVIVPDFGAFMVKIDAGDKTVTFNDFLKYNDGLLVNHIASKEKISKDDAFKKIREFVKELLNTLKTSQKFTLGTMGSLVKDERGGIRFVAEKSTNTVSPEDAVESEKVEATTDETAPKATGKTVVDVKKDEKAPIKPGAPLGQKPAATPPPPIPGQRPEQLGKPTVKPGTPPPPQGRNPNIAPKKAPKKNNTTTILIIVGIVVVLGVIGGLISLNYDEWVGKAERERLAEEAHQTELVMKAQQDSIREVERVQDSIRIATAEAEELARQKEIEKNQKKYYLVAGSFKVQKNAQRFSEQLNSQGYKSEVFMESRGFWRVSYNSFIDRREAFNEYQKLKQNEIQVWVIRH
jgi:nucleoid DNA-binding protein